MSAAPITTVTTVVETIEDGGAGVKLFSLVDPDHWELPPFRPGAHIDLHLPGGMVRTYSLCNDPADDGRYLVAVKREGCGRGGSVKLHDEIRVGDSIGVSLPRGGLDLPDDVERFIFVAGGIGVTPFLSAAAFLQRTGGADFTLHVLSRGEPPLRRLLAPLAASGHLVLHDTAARARPALATIIGRQQRHIGLGCCGPESMIDDFEHAAGDWPAERVHIERFVPPPLPVDPNAKPYTLVLARSRLETRVAPGQTMLSAIQSLNVDIPASCCGGICGSCKVNWLEGTPVHRDRVLSLAERARSLMVCVAGSADERLVLDL